MDIATAAVASGGTVLLLGGLLYLTHRLIPDARGVRRAAGAFAMVSLALLVYAWYPLDGPNRFVWPVPVSVILAALYAGQLAHAIRDLTDAPPVSLLWWWLVAAVCAAGALMFVSPAWLWPAAGFAQFALGVLFGRCARLAARQARGAQRAPLWMMAGSLAVSSGSYILWSLHVWTEVVGRPARLITSQEATSLAWNIIVSNWLMLVGGVGFILAVLSQVMQRLVDASVTDPLTQVLNRRGLERRLRTLLADRTVAPSRLGVAVIDLDHFKRINDTHGHAAGDDVLVWCARRMGAALRGGDILCRAGGEEFVVVVPDADAALTRDVAERLRAAIAQSPARVRGGANVPVTVSIGVVATDASPTGFDRALELADAALYTAKQAGRNRVVVAEHPAGGAGGAPVAAPAA